jgi:hypothetical protein
MLALRGERVKKVRRWPVAVACLLAGAAAGAAAAIATRRPATPAMPAPTPFPRRTEAEQNVSGAPTTEPAPGTTQGS